MLNKLRFGHLQRFRHPHQEPQVRPVVQVHNLLHDPGLRRAAPQTPEIPLGEVHSVVEWLQPQDGKYHQEHEGAEDVDPRGQTQVAEGGHERRSSGGQTPFQDFFFPLEYDEKWQLMR